MVDALSSVGAVVHCWRTVVTDWLTLGLGTSLFKQFTDSTISLEQGHFSI